MIETIIDYHGIPEGLEKLKLRHWKKKFEQDWSSLSLEEQNRISPLLNSWIQSEFAERTSYLIRKRIANAKFIRTQTIDQYNFDYNPSTRRIQADYTALHHRTQLKQEIPRAVFVGTTGLGKTHLGRALGYAACQAGLTVSFVKASQIVNDLATAKSLHQLEREIRKYRKPSVLIIDELGYVSMGAEEGNLFFQVISDRHDRGLGTIVTTNFAFGHWNQIFASESTAVVTVERLTANAEVFYLEGDSYPQTQRKKGKK